MAVRIPILFQINKLGLVGAQKELRKLSSQTKAFGLTSTLSIGAASAAITAYSKRSVAAAVADQKAQATLAQTLKNVGQAFATDSVTKYVDSLQRVTGVSEELLRPAFEKLVRATGDVAEAQRLLNLTLDITASTGKSTEAVSASLSKAFLGQTQALGRLGIGLSKAELKTSTFEQITAKLTVLFAGQAQVAAETYAGQLNILGVAAQEASETIGVALIDSLINLSGQNGITDLAEQMDVLAQNTANTVTGMSEMARLGKEFAGVAITIGAIAAMLIPAGKLAKPAMTVVNLFKSKKVIAGAAIAGGFVAAEKLGENIRAVPQGTNRQSPRVAEAAAAKAAKSRKTEIADRTKILGLTKAQAANEKLSRMFDMDSIQLAAALQGKLSKEDEARVKALQALKTEDKNDDIRALEELEAAKRAATFAEIDRMKTIVEASKKANEAIIADARARLAALQMPSNPVFTGHLGLPPGTNIATPTPIGSAVSTFQDVIDREMAIDMPFMPGDPGFSGTANQNAAPTNLTVNLQGGINVGSTYEFYQTVQTALQELNRAGNSLTSAGS
jgi:hypothetical protein